MTFEQSPAEGPPSDIKLIYYLYFAGIFFFITAVIGVVIAYVNKGDGPEWVETHYHYQIRTFWLGLIGLAICTVLTFVLIGYLLLLVLGLWWIVRAARGLKFVSRGLPVPGTENWI